MTVISEVINMDFLRGGDREFLAYICQRTHVAGLVETKDRDIKKIVPAGWGAWQDRSTTGKANVAFIWNESIGSFTNGRLRKTVTPYLHGRRIKMEIRYTLTGHFWAADGTHLYPIVHHFAPPRFRGKWRQSYQKIRKIVRNHPNAVGFFDVNRNPRVAAESLGLKWAAGANDDVMLLGAGKSIKPVGEPVHSKWGEKNDFTDHRGARRELKSV